MGPTILLTRPEAQSDALAETLRARGWTPLVAPMLTFETLTPPPGFDAQVKSAAALAFTSANGVRAFAAASDHRDAPVFAVGDATRAAAREAGFADVRSAAGDAAALERLIIEARPAGPILHVRGEDARGDLAERLSAAGLSAGEAALYRMRAADALPEAVRAALAAGAVSAAAFFSPRTASAFAELTLAAGLTPLPHLRAIAISAAAAAGLAPLGLGRVIVAERPDGPAMLDAIGAPDDQGA